MSTQQVSDPSKESTSEALGSGLIQLGGATLGELASQLNWNSGAKAAALELTPWAFQYRSSGSGASTTAAPTSQPSAPETKSHGDTVHAEQGTTDDQETIATGEISDEIVSEAHDLEATLDAEASSTDESVLAEQVETPLRAVADEGNISETADVADPTPATLGDEDENPSSPESTKTESTETHTHPRVEPAVSGLDQQDTGVEPTAKAIPAAAKAPAAVAPVAVAPPAKAPTDIPTSAVASTRSSSTPSPVPRVTPPFNHTGATMNRAPARPATATRTAASAEEYLAQLEQLVVELNMELCLPHSDEQSGSAEAQVHALTQRLINLSIENLQLRRQLAGGTKSVAN